MFFLCLLVLFSSARADTVRFSISDAWGEPLLILDSSRVPSDGIIFDMAKEFERVGDHKVEFVHLSRVDTEDVAIEPKAIRCHVNPYWFKRADDFEWSSDLYTIYDVVFGRTGTKPVTSIRSFVHGEKLTAVKKYRYRALDGLFSRGALVRDDAVSQDAVFRQMTTYGVSNELALAWLLKQNPNEKIANWRFVIDETSIHCAYPKTMKFSSYREADKTFQKMRASGFFHEMLKKYK